MTNFINEPQEQWKKEKERKITGEIEQAELEVPHSEIQVELD